MRFGTSHEKRYPTLFLEIAIRRFVLQTSRSVTLHKNDKQRQTRSPAGKSLMFGGVRV